MACSGQSWRLPLWLWLSVAAMAVSTLRILLGFGVGLSPLQGNVTSAAGAVLLLLLLLLLLLISLIQAWWGISIAAGARGVARRIVA